MRSRARDAESGRITNTTVCGRRHCRTCKRWRPVVDFGVRKWADAAKTRPRYFRAECQTCHARYQRRYWQHSPDHRRRRTEQWRLERVWRRQDPQAFLTWWADNGHRWRPIYSASQEVDTSPLPREPLFYNEEAVYYIMHSLRIEPCNPVRPYRGRPTPAMDFLEMTEFKASDLDDDPRELEAVRQWRQLHPDVRAAIGKRVLWPYVRDAYPGGFDAIVSGRSDAQALVFAS